MSRVFQILLDIPERRTHKAGFCLDQAARWNQEHLRCNGSLKFRK